tara:strand:+ start:154 stop:1713 length:1560 start_codon:yes stop_codon:yes gene_type:complete
MSKIKLTGSNSGYVEISSAADAGNLTLNLPTSGTALLSNGDNVYTGITTFSNDLKLEGGSYDVLWDSSDNQLEFGDNAKLSFGASSDLSIYHDGIESLIKHTGAGVLKIEGNGTNNVFLRAKTAENSVTCKPDGAVELYHNNIKKIETTSTGAVVTGIMTATEIVSTSTQLSHRNKFINGAMRFSQRATSFTSTLADTQYILDRFAHIIRGTNDSYYYQVTDHPEGFSNSMKVSPNSTYTPSASDNAGFQSYIEGQDLQDLNFGSSNAKSFTVSFYAKSASQNNGHQYTFQIRSYPSGGAATRIKNFPFTVTTSWQRFSFTFTGDTGADIANTNGAGFAMLWNLNAGPDDITSQYTNWTSLGKYMCVTGQSNFLDNTNNEFYLTGVQLEVGSVATPFEHRSYGEELRLCQRYFYKVQGDQGERVGIGGCAVNTTEFRMNVTFPVAMRQVPGISGTGTAQMDAATDSANFNCNNVTIESAPSGIIHSLGLQAVTSGMVGGQGGNLRFRSNGSSLMFSAEI